MVDEREYYVSLVLPKDQLIKRWHDIGYKPPKTGQLKLL